MLRAQAVLLSSFVLLVGCTESRRTPPGRDAGSTDSGGGTMDSGGGAAIPKTSVSRTPSTSGA
jgi:hypothetical protein